MGLQITRKVHEPYPITSESYKERSVWDLLRANKEFLDWFCNPERKVVLANGDKKERLLEKYPDSDIIFRTDSKETCDYWRGCIVQYRETLVSGQQRFVKPPIIYEHRVRESKVVELFTNSYGEVERVLVDSCLPKRDDSLIKSILSPDYAWGYVYVLVYSRTNIIHIGAYEINTKWYDDGIREYYKKHVVEWIRELPEEYTNYIWKMR